MRISTIGAGLPFAGSLPALEEALTRATPGVAVVQAPPGTGKTTLVPPLLANRLARRGGGVAGAPQRVVVTAPRRVAARAAASRLAALAGETLGGSVGFTVRGAREVGRDTLVEMVTPGILLRRLLADPALPGVGAGGLLVFILCMGYYITPALLGSPKEQMASYFVAFYTNQTINWGMAAALSAILFAATLMLYMVYSRLIGRQELASKSR